MDKNKTKTKIYYLYKNNLGVISITDNINKWKAIPCKKKLFVRKLTVDFTQKEKPEGDSPNIIAYKKRRGLILEED